MKSYDWIVIGAGISGSALSYELAIAGFSVLMIEQSATPQNATRYSYGGIAYWSATTDLMRQLCQEGIERHRLLSAELDGDTQFQELDLLLTIAPMEDPETCAASYRTCMIPPALISLDQACEMEPLLNPTAIAAALHVRHGHIDPEALTHAYQQAFLRRGGTMQIGQVTELLWSGDRIQGVVTSEGTCPAAQVVVCAGGMSRALLKSAGIPVCLYYTQAELIETPPVEVTLQTMVMPAALKRFVLEAEAGRPDNDALWNVPNSEVAAPILDAGVIQFRDGRLRIGQISRTFTDPLKVGDALLSEATMRTAIGSLIPALQTLGGTWHSCLVAFSGDRLPLIGSLPSIQGLYLFSGFSSPFAIIPPLARRFAHQVAGSPDELIAQLSPTRLTPA